jgi:threonine synthase
MSFVKGLQCRECKKEYPVEPLYVCEECLGPLEVVYDYEGIKRAFHKEDLHSYPYSMWRYRPLLPIEGEPCVGQQVGMTPLLHAKKLGDFLGLKRLFIKNDAVNFPTLSFKDRVVSVAISKAIEFGFDTVACASTGNLANSLAAQAAAASIKSYVFIPSDLEPTKIMGSLIYGTRMIAVEGSYDDVNRLCTEISSLYPWAFVNVNLRPFYSEGSKTFAFEIAEQLGWRIPDHIVVPVAGCSLLTKIWKGFKELETIGWIKENSVRIHAAQATGCSPVTTAIKEGSNIIKPVKPNTIAKSLAIGNPADGHYGLKIIRESGGYGEDVTDDKIVEGIKLLAHTEGIFAETAGGVVVGVTKKLVEEGIIGKEDLTVISITGNGLKTQEVLTGKIDTPIRIAPNIDAFSEILERKERRKYGS